MDNLFNVVRIRNIGERLGFEKIIIKNGLLICFFISNQMSPYYKSDVFSRILGRIASMESVFSLKQGEGRLKTVSRGVDSLDKALALLAKLQ